MKRLFFWVTMFSGLTAAYLMFRRGESLGTIAQQTLANPVGTLIHEVENAI